MYLKAANAPDSGSFRTVPRHFSLKYEANGEGSIRKRKDGRWEGRYTAGYDKDGKVITKNVLGKTQAEVKEKLKTAIEESQKLDPTRTGQ